MIWLAPKTRRHSFRCKWFDLTSKLHSIDWFAFLFHRSYITKKSLEKCEADLEEKAKNLKEHDEKYEAIIKERTEKELQIKEEMA